MRKPNSLSIGVMAYNEEEYLERTVKDAIQVLNRTGLDYEILIFNDGSSDRTGQIAIHLARKNKRIKVIHHRVNKGVGISIREAIKKASKEFFTYIPGDYQFDIKSINRYVRHMEDHDCLIGYIINTKIRQWYRRVASQIFANVIKLLFHIDIKYTNGFNFIKSRMLKSIHFSSTGHTISSEIIVKVLKFRKARFKNIPFKLVKKDVDVSTAFKPGSIVNAMWSTFLLWKDITILRKKF
ncbi:MAG: glycosyltransferase family 2 protein [Spirochaetes bacterium]|nr:glycosyltransferase family 2 protein [Spirochaetota bacterium]